MSRIRLAVGAAILAAGLVVSAQAQAPAQPAPAAQPTPAAQPATPSKMDKVKSWTRKKWDASKAEMQKDKAKWDGCVAKAHDQKLKMSSKAGWAFVYDCMKNS